jgi:nucleoside triphosphate diphosphatase
MTGSTTGDTRKTIDDLLAVMAALRAPGTGCPWDLAQTFKTIAPYTIEEAYEVADAIENSDMGALGEELGDLLLQVVYHARMAEEVGAFAFPDVVDGITAKMIRRHPHVFGSAAERAAGAAPGFWERIKAQEKAALSSAPSPLAEERQWGGDAKTSNVEIPPTSSPQQGGGTAGSIEVSILDDIPAALPALTRAVKLQNKAARVGFDWPSLAPVLDKLKEELGELEQAVDAQGSPRAETAAGSQPAPAVVEEFGDLLFVVANVARHLRVDPEAALRAANHKFTRRFRRIEVLLAADGRSPAQSSLEEMDRLWDRAKAEERSPSS